MSEAVVFEPIPPEELKGAKIVRAGPQGFTAVKDGKMIIVHASIDIATTTGCPDECSPEAGLDIFMADDPYKTMSPVEIRPEELVGRRVTIVRVFDDEIVMIDEDTNEVFSIGAYAALPTAECENTCEPEVGIDARKFVNKYPAK